MSEAGQLVSRIYSHFRGVDFRGDEVNFSRSPDSLNMWKDYREIDSIRTRPGMRLKQSLPATVYGIFFYKGSMLVHSGTSLWKLTEGAAAVLYTGLNQRESQSFVYGENWYFKDGLHYLCYDGTEIKEVEGYIPTTTISRKPKGGGTQYEDINMLSDFRINTFLADGESVEYVLDAKNIDSDYAPIVTVNDAVVHNYTVDYLSGIITFTEAPEVPLTDGRDNVSVQFKKAVPGYRENILNCTLLQVFDNRVFFSGNPDHPNTVWHCSLNDPGYCSDLDYYREGLDSAAVKGLVAGNNALWVFREPSQANTTVFYHTPAIDSDYGKIYPSQHSSVTTGCVGKAINFNDDIIFFSERGMEGISGDITTEQAIAHRSSLVDRKMLSEPGYPEMILAEWEGYLLIFIGSKAYLADSRAKFSNTDHMEYEFFYWDMGMTITCARVEKGALYLGTDTGIYTLSDLDGAVECWWTTPVDKFRNPNKLKTTNKRGSVAEATGDISVSVKLEDTGFELTGEFNGVTDYFVSRIKRKKWKDIQLKFHSRTRFGLETFTMEAFVGGYTKR